jgi:hypothetical protein
VVIKGATWGGGWEGGRRRKRGRLREAYRSWHASLKTFVLLLHPFTSHLYSLVLLVSDEEDSLSWSEVSEPGVCGIAGAAGKAKGVL